MGFLDFMFEEADDTNQKPSRRRLSDILFEEVDDNKTVYTSSKSKKKPSIRERLSNIFFEEEKPEVEFADPNEVQNMSETLGGKLQDKKRELTMMGMALRQINVKEFPGSEKIIQEYLELLEVQKRLATLENSLQEDDIMGRISLERDYEEFEQKYNERIPRIKTLFYYKELKRQNTRMKSAFSQSIRMLSQEDLEDFKEYIQKIKEQQQEFSDDYKDEILSELLTAEYRLGMLNLMKDYYLGEEPLKNPFSMYSQSKKDRFAELLLGDITDADEQFQNIMQRQGLYTRTNVISSEDFEKLSSEADTLNSEINNGIIDDLSISGMFENSQYNTLKMFLRLKIKMNEIDSRYEQATDIDTVQYLNSQCQKKGKKRRKRDYEDDEPSGR